MNRYSFASAIIILAFLLSDIPQVQAQVSSLVGLHFLSSMQRLELQDVSTPNTILVGTYRFPHEDCSWYFDNVKSYSTQIEYRRRWSARFSTDVRLSGYAHRLSSYYHTQPRGQVYHGLGDIFVMGNYHIISRVVVHGGLKAPLSNGNMKYERSQTTIPMEFQPSTGTFDLVAAVSLQAWRLQVFAAWQQPVTRSDFNFSSSYHGHWLGCGLDYIYGSPPIIAPDAKNHYQMAGRLFLRVKAPILLSERWVLSPALAALAPLRKDRFLGPIEPYVYRPATPGMAMLTTDLDVRLYRNLFVQMMTGFSLTMLCDHPFNHLLGGIELRQHF